MSRERYRISVVLTAVQSFKQLFSASLFDYDNNLSCVLRHCPNLSPCVRLPPRIWRIGCLLCEIGAVVDIVAINALEFRSALFTGLFRSVSESCMASRNRATSALVYLASPLSAARVVSQGRGNFHSRFVSCEPFSPGFHNRRGTDDTLAAPNRSRGNSNTPDQNGAAHRPVLWERQSNRWRGHAQWFSISHRLGVTITTGFRTDETLSAG